MEIRTDCFINELGLRTIKNYQFIKDNCKKEGLNEVTQLINSMFCLLILPQETFGKKAQDFPKQEKNLKKYEAYHKILDFINKIEKENRIKYASVDAYVQDSPVCSLMSNMRNALCHSNVGFLPITNDKEKNEITDIIFRTKSKGEDVFFMMVLSVAQLEELINYTAEFFSEIEKGVANSNSKEYRKHYDKIKDDLRTFLPEFRLIEK